MSHKGMHVRAADIAWSRRRICRPSGGDPEQRSMGFPAREKET